MAKRYTGPYVSRGGEKLAGALTAFNYDCRNLLALDIGASTGGFTDCLLQAGAAQVVALDVAYGQLAWSLRTDDKVSVVERTNIRNADLPALGAPFNLTVADLSFISLVKTLPQMKIAAGVAGDLILLVKPQFEALRAEVPEGGVIVDARVHEAVLTRLDTHLRQAGLDVLGWTHSPLKGPKGNIEFWVWARPQQELTNVSNASTETCPCATIESVVQTAHDALNP
jgi:23S rRNA (cytidine1920-2'-O)/16S rRNA (cytidine1409-2'-O)-methyltransferase